MYKASSFCSFFKGGAFIEGYLENLFKQTTFGQTEWVFIDCASPDKESRLIQPLCRSFPNIKYVRLDTDPGLYGGWNVAIKHCTAPIVTNWNIDDRKSHNGNELLLKMFDRHIDLDITYGLTYISTIANEKYEENDFTKVYPCLPHSWGNLLANNSPHCMPMWKRSLHDRFGLFDESYKTASDADMWLRAAKGGAHIRMLNHPVGLYYHNPTGRSTNPETLKEMIEEVKKMREKYQ